MRQPSSITVNTFDWALKIFVFLLPIIWLPNFTQKNLQLLFFNYGSLILFGLSISLPARREFRNHNVFVLLFLCVVVSLVRNPYTFSISFINIVFGCLLYYAIVRSVSDIRGILKWFVYIVGINLFVLVLQMAGMDLIYTRVDVNGSLHNALFSKCGLMARNYNLAFLLAFAIPIVAIFRKWNILLIVLMIGALTILKSYAAMLAFIVGVLVLLCLLAKNWKQKLLMSIPLVGALVYAGIKLFISHGLFKFSSRFPVWKFLWKESLANPFIGKGLDSFNVESSLLNLQMGNLTIVSSFNEYLRLTYEFGIIPFAILACCVIHYYKKLFSGTSKNILTIALFSSLIALFVIPMFHEIFRFIRISVLGVVILALWEASMLDNQKEEVC